MDAISSLIAYIAGFFDLVGLFFSETLPGLLKDGIEWMMIKSMVLYIEAKIFSIEFAWGIAEGVLDAFNIGPLVSGYISSLSPNIGYAANAMGIFDALNIVIQAGVSSFVLRFMRV